jgi:hypothetical protein
MTKLSLIFDGLTPRPMPASAKPFKETMMNSMRERFLLFYYDVINMLIEIGITAFTIIIIQLYW